VQGTSSLVYSHALVDVWPADRQTDRQAVEGQVGEGTPAGPGDWHARTVRESHLCAISFWLRRALRARHSNKNAETLQEQMVAQGL
jgi:hypothetical protein